MLLNPNKTNQKVTHSQTRPSFLVFFFGLSEIHHRHVPVEGPVAFFAAKRSPQERVGINQVIMFDHVRLNLGNGYQPLHGIFVAPRAGIYLLSAAKKQRR